MSAFALSTPSPTECPTIETHPTLQHPSALLFGPDAPIHPDECTTSGPGDSLTANMKTDYTSDVAGYLDVQDFLLSPADTIPLDVDMGMNMLPAEKPGPLVELTSLLADMSPYENQLAKLNGSELDNYPIGDALFLSQRLYAILCDYGHPPHTDSSSHFDMPTMLLTLSCYMTLTRIYSAVFSYLQEQLPQLLNAHSAYKATRPSHPFTSDLHAYRGLRLHQLRSISLCASWEPAKKAVSMLLGSLSGVEGMLGLPADVRVIATPRAEAQGDGAPSPPGSIGERTVLFEEGLIIALTNGRLYKNVRKQVRELRGKIEEVDDFLKELLETYPMFPECNWGDDYPMK